MTQRSANPGLASRAASDFAPISVDRYREIFAAVPAAVAVVTSARPGAVHGTTVSSFTSLSLDPPLVLVCLDRDSELLSVISRARGFCVSVLAEGQEELGFRFARKGVDKFDGVPWVEKHGLPVLRGAQSWLAANVERVIAAGDHMMVTGLVFDGEAGDGVAIVYRAGRFQTLAQVGNR